MKIRNKEDAIAAYVSYRGGLPEGYEVSASVVANLEFELSDGACLWKVRQFLPFAWQPGFANYDESYEEPNEGMPTTIIGPDGRAWNFSDALRLDDSKIVETALTCLYLDGVADLVDPDMLAERLQAITMQKALAMSNLPDAARRGDLRPDHQPSASTLAEGDSVTDLPSLRQRALRVLSMVGELHKRGYQRLRVVPSMSGLRWSCRITPASNTLRTNGGHLAYAGSDRHLIADYRDGDSYFRFGDRHRAATARVLADTFAVRYPELCASGRGADWAYAGWFVELLGLAEQGWFPNCYTGSWPINESDPPELINPWETSSDKKPTLPPPPPRGS